MILSAGAYQSPVLLMLSGIGPEDQLAPFGIEVREALPVGEGLQDHCMAQVNYLTDEPSLFMAADAREHRAARVRGPRAADLEHPRGGRASSAPAPDVDAPDVEFHFAPSMFFDEGLTAPSDHGVLLRPGRDQARRAAAA